jgi:hypothetical protein
MPKTIILEPARDQPDRKRQVVLDQPVWAAMCGLGRLNGFAVTDEYVLPQVDARLFANALKAGANDLTAGSVLAEPTNRAKLSQVISLLEAGGIIITMREK